MIQPVRSPLSKLPLFNRAELLVKLPTGTRPPGVERKTSTWLVSITGTSFTGLTVTVKVLVVAATPPSRMLPMSLAITVMTAVPLARGAGTR